VKIRIVDRHSRFYKNLFLRMKSKYKRIIAPDQKPSVKRQIQG
jgi:hypothetical protein